MDDSNINEDNMNQNTTKLVLSPREAAKAFSVREKTLYTRTKKYNIPVIRLGRAVRYPVDGLKAWIEKQSQDIV